MIYKLYKILSLLNWLILFPFYGSGSWRNFFWIGVNVIITAGVKISNQSVVGAGSVVTSNIEPYSMVVGSPAK